MISFDSDDDDDISIDSEDGCPPLLDRNGDDCPPLLVRNRGYDSDDDSDDESIPDPSAPRPVPMRCTQEPSPAQPILDSLPAPSVGKSPARAMKSIPLPSPEESLATKNEREAFLRRQPSRVQTMINQPFGKENIVQCFKAAARLRHVLFPIWKSGFLEDGSQDWINFCLALPEVHAFMALLKEHINVDIHAIRGFRIGFEADTELSALAIKQTTAAVLHFEGDIAALIRWIGGSHVGAHRDRAQTLHRLRPKLPQHLFDELTRIFYSGIPRQCNVSATEANFQAFYQYGNHSTVDKEPTKTYKALLKDAKRGYVLPFDKRVIPYVLNCHVTPQGMVDLEKPNKKPRPIFDSTFRPEPWCSAINDWTTKDTEKEVLCAYAEIEFMTWLWNLRITYPDRDLFIGDDDVSGAFRWLKYHPNLVAMHTSVQAGYGVFNTGGTFGDNTTPSNWDGLADSRRHVAQWHWLHDPNVVSSAKQYLPQLQFATQPRTMTNTVQYAMATADAIHKGVLDDNGQRIPPSYDHHVDDNLYADVQEYMPRTVSSSVISLYEIIGYPQPIIPDALSQEKFDAMYTHRRTCVGRTFDTRTMTVEITEEKKTQLIDTLQLFLKRPSYSLTEAAEVHGLLENHTRHVNWARPWFYAIQNSMRRQFRVLFRFLQRRFRRDTLVQRLQGTLPQHLWKRIEGLISKEQATWIWRHRSTITMTRAVKASIQMLLTYLQDNNRPWAAKIGLVIQREPTTGSLGDASNIAGGAHCQHTQFWLDIVWPSDVRQAITLPRNNRNHVHINSLEYAVVLLQLAAHIVRFRTMTPAERAKFYPSGIPALPTISVGADNTSAKSWANKLTTKSSQGQALIAIQSEILRQYDVGLNCYHIPGVNNVLADEISRPPTPSLTLSQRAKQLTTKHPFMRTWLYFQPHPQLIQLIISRLCMPHLVDLPRLPSPLGRFVPTASIISNGLPLWGGKTH